MQLFDGGLGQTICLGRAACVNLSVERWPEFDGVEAERKCAAPGLPYWMEVARVFLVVSGRESFRSGTVASASSAGESDGDFPAAAFSRSKGQPPKFPSHTAKKDFSIFVKTLNGKTKVFSVSEGLSVLQVLEVVEGKEAGCVQYNGKSMGMDDGLGCMRKDDTLRIVGRV